MTHKKEINISNIQIHKRTFEGNADATKNNNPITSKYFPSNKYTVTYDMEGYFHNPTSFSTTTKKKAKEFIEELGLKYNITD